MRAHELVLRSCLLCLLVVFLVSPAAAGVEGEDEAGPGYLTIGEDAVSGSPDAPAMYHNLKLYPLGTGKGSILIRPGKKECTGSCEEIFYDGTKVLLVARPEKGYVFDGWSGTVPCPHKRRCGFAMDDDVSIGYSFVAGSPSIRVTPLSHGFDNQPVGGGDPEGVRISISNARGKASLAVSDMTLGDTVNFSLVTDDGPAGCGSGAPVLDPGRHCTVKVFFDPKSAGYFETGLGIASNDPDTPLVTVQLSGTGESAGPVTVSISLPGASSASRPELAYRMVGIPVMPTDPDTFSTLCPYFGGYADSRVWRLFRLVSGRQVAISRAGQDKIAYGKGWWLVSSEDKILEITGMPHVGKWRRRVPAGYFLLASPYHDRSVRWADILNDRLNARLRLGADLFYWDGSGQYVTTDTLEPGKAYMAFAEQGGFLRILRRYLLSGTEEQLEEPVVDRSVEVIQPPPPPPPPALGRSTLAPVP